MLDTWLPLAGGLVLLIAGGDLLVRGAVLAACRFGVSPLVIGLTLVGFGTSTPELVTSVQAALRDAPGIAYGNIVGSNIANGLLIVGVSAMFYPMVVTSVALRRDGLFMIAATVTFAGIASTLPMERWIGALFVAALCTYICLAVQQERQAVDHAKVPASASKGSMLRPVVMTSGGLALVILGGYFLVEGAVTLAQSIGVSEAVIGLTIVAIGTSLPELMTSVVAALRKQSDVAFGSIVGSNIYNILFIGGATALIAPGAVPAEIAGFDTLVMLGVAVALVAFAATGRRIARWEGCALLTAYGGYVYILWP